VLALKQAKNVVFIAIKGERICKNIKEKGYTEVGLRGKSDSDSERGDSEGGDSEGGDSDSEGGDSDSEALDLKAQLIVK